MRSVSFLLILGILACSTTRVLAADSPTYEGDVVPLLDRYCTRCHGGKRPKAGLALDHLKTQADAIKHSEVWTKVVQNLRDGTMPPEGRRRPTPAEVQVVDRWVEKVVFHVDCKTGRDPGRVTLRRLNRAEYNNTIRDLTGVDFQPAKDFPDDDVGYGFDNIGDVLSLPPVLLEKYLAAADTIIEEAFRSPESRKRLLPRPLEGKGNLSFNIRSFATRAYRRPVSDEEVGRLLGLVRLARDNGDDREVGFKLACKAILVSPHFLFRVEKDPPDPNAIRLLNEYELASRLSYFLWSSMPDAELFRLAQEGRLRQPGVLEGQVKRMLQDERARALVDNFAAQWLQLRDLKEFSPDPKRFPDFDESLRQAMRQETEEFFLHIVHEDRSILDFLDGNYTFVNGRLARHYGLTGVKGSTFQKVSLEGTPRGGLLTQASILSVTSNPTRTSPVKRGKWVLDNLLGMPPPPPPPNVPQLQEDGSRSKGTLRQQMEQHRQNPVCASCHQRMDPIGFALENFGAIGAWRTMDGKHPIDASGALPSGKEFKGPVELRAVLKEQKEAFARCLTEKLLTFALGRGLERTDRCYVDDIVKDLEQGGYRFSRLVLAIVHSDPFQKRTGKRVKP
jgi:hypothetical protein